MDTKEIVALFEVHRRATDYGDLFAHIRDEALKRLKDQNEALAPPKPEEPKPTPYTAKGKA